MKSRLERFEEWLDKLLDAESACDSEPPDYSEAISALNREAQWRREEAKSGVASIALIQQASALDCAAKVLSNAK